MDKRLLIENKILTLDGIAFENLFVEICSKRYLPTCIEHIGKIDGSNKPNKSKVDIYFKYIEHGKEHTVFVLATTEKSPFKSGKVNEDLEKAIHYLDSVSDRFINPCIFFALNSSVDPVQAELYKDKCKKNNLELVFFGLGTITELLLNRYPEIAENSLGVPMSFGALVDIEKITSYTFGSNDFSQKFMYRENEISNVISHLRKEKVVVVYGPPGCGKTKLSLEVAKNLKDTSGFECYYAKNSNVSIIQDIKNLISINKNTLILVDDANKAPYLIDILNYTEEYENIYVLITIRDYVFDKFTQDFLNQKFYPIKLNCLTNEQISQIIKTNYPNITNGKALKYIQQVAKGNLRFAIITAKVLIEGRTAEDLSAIIKSFYSAIEQELTLDDKDFKNFVYAISFFEKLNCYGKETVELLSKVFKFDAQNVKKYIHLGEEKEIFKISETKESIVVEMADQVYASYLCHKMLYVDYFISLQDLIDYFFKDYSEKIVDLLRSILSVYVNHDNEIANDLNKILVKLEEQGNFHSVFKFLHLFGDLIPAESIRFAFQTAADNETNLEFRKQGVEILSRYYEDKDFYKQIVSCFETLFEFPNLKGILVDCFKEHIHITRRSIHLNYAPQIELLSKLNNLTNENLEIFASLINNFIIYEREETEFDRETNRFNIYRFNYIISTEYVVFRELLWKLISKIVLNGYYEMIKDSFDNNSYISKDNYELRKIDAVYVLKIIDSLPLDTFQNKMLAFKLAIPFRKLEEFKPLFDKVCNDKTMEVYRVFINQYTSRSLFYDAKRDVEIKKFLVTNFENSTEIVNFLVDLNEKFGSKYEWKITYFLNEGFNIIYNNDAENYDNYIIYYLQKNKEEHCNLFSIFNNAKDKIKILEFLFKEQLDTNPFYMSPLLLSLDKKILTKEIVSKATKFFTSNLFFNKSPIWGNESLTSLSEYNLYDSSFFRNICLKYKENNKLSSHFLESLFYFSKDGSTLLNALENDLELMADIYFEQISKGSLYDGELYYGLFIIGRDRSYFRRCIEVIAEYKADYKLMHYLENDDQFIEVFTNCLKSKTLFSILQFSYSLIIRNFSKEVFSKFLEYIVANCVEEKFLFAISNAIADRGLTSRVEFLEKCLNANVAVSILEKVPLLDGPRSWSGNLSVELRADVSAFKKFILENGHKYPAYLSFLNKKLNNLEEYLKNIEAAEINKNQW